MKALLVISLLVSAIQAAIIITAGPDPTGHAEVQNLIRNSEQLSWCRLGGIRQIVAHENCENQELENNVCAGSCTSYWLPQTLPFDHGQDGLNYCDSCKATESHWVNVTLSCMVDDIRYEEKKLVQKITNCSCSPCTGSSRDTTPVVIESIEEDNMITGLLNRALLPPTKEQIQSRKDQLSPFNVLLSQLTTTPTLDLVLTTMTPPIDISVTAITEPSIYPTKGISILGDLLSSSDDNEILLPQSMVVPSELHRLVNMANFEKPGLAEDGNINLKPFETENDSNALDDDVMINSNSQVSSGLENTVKHIYELIEREGTSDFSKLSLSELQNAINFNEPHPPSKLLDETMSLSELQNAINFNEPHPPSKLLDETMYSAAPTDQTKYKV